MAKKGATPLVYERLKRLVNPGHLRPGQYELLRSDRCHSGCVLSSEGTSHKFIVLNDLRMTKEKIVFETAKKSKKDGTLKL